MSQPGKIGRYDIVSEIGRGAMGVVYRAVDPMLERTVAIKTINMALDPGDIEHYEQRFIVEARAAGSLNHPHIVTIYDIGRSGDLAYMAMEFLDGRELKDLLANKELTADRALDIAAQVADGLAYAHHHDVVHRDIKPANIMILRDGRVKITDFGIARMRTADVRTQTGVVLGSPRYLSPEQVLGKRCDARADTFSLGVIIYEMVTGQTPFNGIDVNSLMFQIVNFIPPPPTTVNSALPPMLDLIIAKALAKTADERYARIADLAADLRACRQQGLSATTVPLPVAVPHMTLQTTADLFKEILPASRAEDHVPMLAGDALPARGLAKEFDSMAATMRLAVKTGAVTDTNSFAANFGVSRHAIDAAIMDTVDESERNWGVSTVMQAPPWSRRDRNLFRGAVAGALAVGALIVFI
ncbi:MAG: serine/threonine protein kinase [Betaproteobacteria bacterium]|nr:MAG: serine/threonine protein kinase [Betaproteobacteria bacterium]